MSRAVLSDSGEGIRERAREGPSEPGHLSSLSVGRRDLRVARLNPRSPRLSGIKPIA